VAQLVARTIRVREVASSSLATPTMEMLSLQSSGKICIVGSQKRSSEQRNEMKRL
jgi:hypothetical protein